MMDQPTDEHCEVCGESKNPRKVTFDVKKKPPSTVDRVRGFVSDTLGSSDTDANSETEESEIGHKEKKFYICPDLSCDGREDDIRKIERWRMKTSIKREFSEEKLDEIVAEKVAQDKQADRILSENADEVYRDMVEQEEEDNTDATDE